MSVGIVNKTTGEITKTAGNIADKVGDLSALHTTAKANAVVAINEVADAVEAIDDGTNIDSFGDVETALAGKADTDIVADDFDVTASYVIGNYCIHEGKLYRFKANHSGAWSSADVEEIQITGELATLKSGLINYQTQNDINLEVPHRKNLGVTIPSKTHNDVVFTSNADGTLSINGLATGYAYTDSIFTLKSGTYYISHGVANLNSNVNLILRNNTTDTYIMSANDTGVLFTLSEDMEVKFRCAVAQGYDADVKIYPMIRPATITDPTFAPYIPSVESRLKALEAAMEQLTNS